MAFLPLLLLFIRSADDVDECKTKGYTATTKLIGKSYLQLKELTARITHGSTEFPEVFDQNAFIQYFKTAVGFIAPIAALFVIMFIYFLVGELFTCCPCCQSKTSGAPKLITTFFHFLFAAFFAISIILLYVAASNITVSVVKIGRTVINLPNEVRGIFNNVSNSLDYTLDRVVASVNSISSEINSISNIINTTQSKAKEEIGGIRLSLEHVQSNLTQLKGATESFDTAANSCTPQQSNKVNTTQGVLNGLEKVKTMNQSIDVLNTSTLDELKVVIENTSKKISDEVDKTVKDLRESKIPNLFSPFQTVVNNFEQFIPRNVKDIISNIEKWSPIIAFIMCGVLTVILLLYIVFYFFNNCCSRCLASNFWIIGFVINLLLGIISIAFAILFAVFFDFCPKIPTILNSQASRFISTKAPIYDILTNNMDALNNTNLLYQLNISFDFDKQIGDVQQKLNKSLEAFNISGITSQLDSLLDFQPADNLTVDNLFPSNIEDLDKIAQVCTNASGPLNEVKSNITKVQTSLDEAIQSSKSIGEITEGLAPKLENTQENIKFLAFDLVDELGKNVNMTIDSLDTKLFCPIYPPLESAICSTLLDGAGLWVVAFYCLFIALFGLSITLCCRRRSMSSHVKPEENA